MKTIKCKDWERILHQNGWQLARISGSHHIYKKTNSDVVLSVPIHAGKDMKIGLLKHQMKLVGIDEKDL